ncbi:MAG: type I restriction endonuclease subunit R [Sporichthyaceae bacterium]
MAGIGYSEAEWEALALETLGELGWSYVPGEAIIPTAPGEGVRESWSELAIRPRLLTALGNLNPGVPAQYLAQAAAEILSPKSQDAITENHRIHGYLIGGYRGLTFTEDGQERTPTLRLISADPAQNEWLAVSQVTLIGGDYKRRLDIVAYCNGMPVSILELKKAGAKNATVAGAHAQLATYIHEFPMAFRFAAFTLASDGIFAKYGTPFTPLNHFSPWSIDEAGTPITTPTPQGVTGLELALFGLYDQRRFTDLLANFTAFDADNTGLAKRIAKPHQYIAVTKAVAATVAAVAGDGKAGVVWHTQGSGKSMEMELYVNLVMRHPALGNPTILVITDRTELDGQLYEGFARSELLPEQPVQITSRGQLRTELSARVTGGIYFTTLPKFARTQGDRDAGDAHPQLSERRNIVVVVDEAHRSHYDDLDGYAHHLKTALPRATLIAFTGTPVSFADRNTQQVFGDYIDVYDLTRAVEDGATVPVYFEQRIVRIALAGEVSEADLDAAATEATDGLTDTERAKAEKAVAVVNALYGAPARLAELAGDLVAHWENRSAAMRPFLCAPGKALIVGATREICANLYAEIIRIRPDWHSSEIDQGRIKVVYSGVASDTAPVSTHNRSAAANATIKNRLRDVDDELELVIVKDMMLTGFDSPPLHTLYLDRPLKGALLMQTLARVNRTYRGKADGLLVAYAPLAENLAAALSEYTSSDQRTKPVGKNVAEAIELTETLVAALATLVAGHDWRAVLAGGGAKARLHAVTSTVNYLRDPATPGNEPPADGADAAETLGRRYRRTSAELARAWALCSGSKNLLARQPEAQFYEEVRVWMAKFDAEERAASGEPVPEEIQRLLAELIATSTETGGVIDVYAAAGMPRPTLSDLGPDFLAKTQAAPNPHLAIEALRKLLTEESAKASTGNVVRARAFSERITELMSRYTNSQLTSAEVIAELVKLAHDVAAEGNRGAAFTPPLSPDELAFYDAVAANDSARELQGAGVLAQIARELVQVMQRDIRTDWTVREDVRAKLRFSIKALLVKYKYPPDSHAEAIKLVLEQMESLAPRYAAERD